LAFAAAGVRHNENPVSSVAGADGRSWYKKRLRGVTSPPQVSKHVVEAQSDVSSNIFTNKPTGSDLLKDSHNFRPEMAVIFRASSLPGVTERLAWVSGGNNVNCSNATPLQLLPCEVSNIVDDRDMRPMFPNDTLTVRLALAKHHCLHTRPMCCKVYSADSRKKACFSHGGSIPHFTCRNDKYIVLNCKFQLIRIVYFILQINAMIIYHPSSSSLSIQS
jgi:hypothetical protein